MTEQQISEILKNHPDLEYSFHEKKFHGYIKAGKNDHYEVEIDFSLFPVRFPLVKEIGERIPRKADRHVYEDTGHFCFTTNARECILLKKEVKTLPDFFGKILLPYLWNNSYYELNGEYAHGEYSHGLPGVIESYQDILGIQDTRLIGRTLHDHIKRRKLRPNDLCFCESKVKIKNCSDHFVRYKMFRLVDREIAENDLMLLLKNLEAQKKMQRTGARSRA